MNKKEVIFFGVIFVLVLISFYFDSEIVKEISLMRNNVFNDFFLGITFASSEIIIFFILTILFFWRENKRKWVLPLWVTMGFSVVVSYVLKILINRQRPYVLEIVETLPSLISSSHLIWNFSFPSFQAMLAFCAVPILAKEFPKFKYIWIVFAGLVAFSRVYFGLHFMSDVLVGGAIGYLIGFIVVKTEMRNKFFERIYKRVF